MSVIFKDQVGELSRFFPFLSSLLEDGENERNAESLGMWLVRFLGVLSFPFFFMLKLEKNPASARNYASWILQPDFAICSIATGLEIMSSCLNLSQKQECLTIGVKKLEP